MEKITIKLSENETRAMELARWVDSANKTNSDIFSKNDFNKLITLFLDDLKLMTELGIILRLKK